MKQLKTIQLQLIVSMLLCCTILSAQDKIIVFSKTAGFRHTSIEVGITALRELANENGCTIDATEDSEILISTLKEYKAVIFLNTTGDVFTEKQKQKFKKYIEKGGGYVGIHAATDTEYEWEWYGKMVGAYFNGHPKQQDAHIKIVNPNHPATKMLGDTWDKFDEWYNFKNINPNLDILMVLDESSYQGGTNGENHPISWCQKVKKGKMFYTGLGHTKESYSDPLFLAHIWGGVEYVLEK